ncbi:MAG TPA: M1 family metallopeptidase [Panacibacter sp.]|nr:M1 family metallopeptidase [Panacibacter sp.]
MRIFALVVCFLGLIGNAYCQQSYWQQQVNYTIDVSLNDESHELTGFVKMEYINNSPDTLNYIYIHLWPNAYKNDRTAFSEQLLKSERTDFYFSEEEQRGYINQLDFKVNNATAIVEEDAKYIDILKLILPQPLAPHASVLITTPFHEKIPYNFSRGGHVGQSYQITQWYPKAALYDKDGWHPMPYLDQGEYYNDFGNYEVHVTLPANYKVGATGVLQGREESAVTTVKKPTPVAVVKKMKPFFPKKKTEEENPVPASSVKQQILSYVAENVSDFAWFADKRFIVKTDTIQLATHTVKATCYMLPEFAELYANSMKFTKRAVRFYSSQLGEYPFPEVNVVSCPEKLVNSGSMEYPMITLINEATEEELDVTMAHEIGHNWLMAILSSNERDHGWMDEGINTYIERKYRQLYYPVDESGKAGRININSLANGGSLLNNMITLKKDQPIETTSENFSYINSGEIMYDKTGDWMKQLEQTVGAATMLQIMHEYYKSYAFKHPKPDDLKKVAEQVTGKDLSASFNKLHQTGWLDSSNLQKPIKFRLILPGTDSKYNYVTISPIAGYNSYDQLMIGGVIHNYQLPLKRLQFLVAPMYATGSSRVTGAARISYNTFKKRSWLELSASGTAYSIKAYLKDDGSKSYLGMSRIVPSVKLTLYNKDLREKGKWIFQLRSFILTEDYLTFTSFKTPVHSTINQIKVSREDNRVLYPYNANLIIDQGNKFLRAGLTANYFFNYKEQGRGLNARFFAGKFFYTSVDKSNSENYFLNMTGPSGKGDYIISGFPKGNEDYTYSNYFIGRNEFEGWKNQQIMERDGFFKVRTDLYSNKVGKTDDWLMALNLSGDIPEKINPFNILPFKLPVKFFLDIGTYSEAWKDNPSTGRFLYDAGLQLSLPGNIATIYLPLLYSKAYSDYFKSILGEKRFWKTVSFTINLSAFQLSKLNRDLPL